MVFSIMFARNAKICVIGSTVGFPKVYCCVQVFVDLEELLTPPNLFIHDGEFQW